MPENLRRIFISHSHKDHPLAAAFRDTLRAIFPGVIVAFSSDKEAGGGAPAGGNWLEWIHNQMLECQEALLLLTPYSVRKPWPMWESGAVAGIALAGAQAGNPEPVAKPVTPIRFNIEPDELPGPFVVIQAVDGRDPDSLRRLLGDLMVRHDFHSFPGNSDVINNVLDAQVPRLREAILEWLDSAPPTVTEGMIDEWCSRLDALRDRKRSKEVGYLHRWIQLMYEGPQAEESDADRWKDKGAKRHTWDLRLHLRLAENYTIAREFEKAAIQYELAKDLAPLDVFVLHRLAQVYFDLGRLDAALRVIDRVIKLDPDAARLNAEVAGLVGRYWKEKARKSQQDGKSSQASEFFREALDAYRAAMEMADGKVDYYMADNVGQLSLTLGDVEMARAVYRKAKAALEDVTPETENVWSLATRTTTALVLDSEEEALRYLERIPTLSPTESQKISIRRGLELVRKALGRTDDEYRRWVEALDRPPAA